MGENAIISVVFKYIHHGAGIVVDCRILPGHLTRTREQSEWAMPLYAQQTPLQTAVDVDEECAAYAEHQQDGSKLTPEEVASLLLNSPPAFQNVNIIQTKVREFFQRRLGDHDMFFSRWNLSDMICELTQELDTSVHTCLYIAASTQGSHSTRRETSGNAQAAPRVMKGRIQCIVGFCKNPRQWIQSKNQRQRRSHQQASAQVGAPSRKWCMLCYVVLERKKYGDQALNELGARISKIKGMENRIIALLQFAIERHEPFRVSKRLFNAADVWHSGSVQRYLSSTPRFASHVRAVCEKQAQDAQPQAMDTG